MKKMKMHSPKTTQANIAHIRELFPSCVTEVKREHGELELAIDFDLLRQELSESIVEGPQERYHLNWPGKREALLTANTPIAKTLRPCREESVDFVYHALNKRELSSTSDLLQNLGNSLAAKNNLNYTENRWLAAVTQVIADNPDDLERFVDEDPYLYERAQFRSLGGINRLQQSPRVLSALDELRNAQAIQKLRKAQRQQR